MNRICTRMLMAFALAAAAVGCTPKNESKKEEAPKDIVAPSPQPIAPAAQWTCKDGQKLMVAFYAEPAMVEINTSILLPQVEGASGALYKSESGRSFHSKGDAAAWKDLDIPETTCTKG